ncbi:hypothetical protein [Peribacillus asahii]|uniref:hypothetical protein n=1 Tax=Peribacillus asahii TaxID=228899 RepID=UPI002079A391|nr:hypothetical protein [Peribacillus asahii]USK72652.1 hypothetical protein LIS76_23285 [Peribacillus asahii]USK72690.1 hypothetical protein LIS76_23870 [Peribacillus asahii]
MYTFVYSELNLVKEFKTLKELKPIVYALHAEFDLRGSTWDWKGAKLYKGKELKLVGRVAYNGRIMND